jgi:CheY-like chemotaxis protein
MMGYRLHLSFFGSNSMPSDPHLPSDLASAHSTAGHPAAGDPAGGSPLRAFGSAGLGAASRRTEAHILVVDDEPINVKVIQKFLAGRGYQHIASAESGQQALDLLAHEMPDLLLLDIFLTDVNGIEVLKRLRALPGGAKLPVLIISASEDPDLKRIALELGVIGFITKPISHSELIAWMQKVLPAGS